MASKLKEFYSRINYNKNVQSIAIDEYNKLKELNEFIYHKVFFSISDHRKKIRSSPRNT